MARTRSAAPVGELAQLRARIEDLQATLEAIRQGGVDAVITGEPGHEQVYTLTSADRPYRLIVQHMNEGAVTVTPHGLILFANPKFAQTLGREPATLIGTSIADTVTPGEHEALSTLMSVTPGEQASAEVLLAGADHPVPALLGASCLNLDGEHVICLVVTDLTGQKQTETVLRASEEQLARHAAEIEQINATLERTVEQRTSELTDALADLQALTRVRLDHAREVNDTIVQVLVAAEMAADLGDVEHSRRLLKQATRAARAWIGEQLVQAGTLRPGSLVRTRPATATDPGSEAQVD